MSDKKRVACFFTGGYTELNAMKRFVEKINSDVEYRQLCPCAPRKSRDKIRNRIHIENSKSGLTGESLIDFVLDSIEKPHFVSESYDAILIEDDKDSRFWNEELSMIDKKEWESFKNKVKCKIIEKGITIPIIFLLASPEVEAWFLADWGNSFGKAYLGRLDAKQNTTFSTIFHKYVNREILTKKYYDSIEKYGYFNGYYKKLSEEIQRALDYAVIQRNDNREEIERRQNELGFTFLKYPRLLEDTVIHYSKKQDGQIMLENIEPTSVLNKCNLFFQEAYYELLNI